MTRKVDVPVRDPRPRKAAHRGSASGYLSRVQLLAVEATFAFVSANVAWDRRLTTCRICRSK